MDNDLYERGLQIRREVLGDEYVQQATARMDDINAPLQELVTQFCWGAVWSRPGLDRKARSMINLSMLAALNRPHELRLHINGALTNGVTEGEIVEILLQATIYCGVPAGIDAFRAVREVFAARKASA